MPKSSVIEKTPLMEQFEEETGKFGKGSFLRILKSGKRRWNKKKLNK